VYSTLLSESGGIEQSDYRVLLNSGTRQPFMTIIESLHERRLTGFVVHSVESNRLNKDKNRDR
jgi:hypothetical protein